MTHTRNLFTALLFTLLVASVYFLFIQPKDALGSVAVSNEYNATTTSATSVPLIVSIRSGQGSLGSVVITGKNTGLMTFYNATTSDVTKRTGQPATSTIMIADFPTNAPEGTYTFDAQFTAGLLLVQSGAVPTTTITFR